MATASAKAKAKAKAKAEGRKGKGESANVASVKGTCDVCTKPLEDKAAHPNSKYCKRSRKPGKRPRLCMLKPEGCCSRNAQRTYVAAESGTSKVGSVITWCLNYGNMLHSNNIDVI